MNKRRICFVTGTRAEYGLLHWLMKGVDGDPSLELQIISTGTHLEPAFGETVQLIENDGFFIDKRVPLGLIEDSPVGIAQAAAAALSGIAEALSELAPDLTILLGDRYEILAAAEAALFLGVPIAHLHGGELTEGAMDDSMRHAISKMSHLHFTAAEVYQKRLIQMGEHPNTVVNVGAIGLENIRRFKLLSKEGLERELGLTFDRPYFLVTYHPETLGTVSPQEAVGELLAALDDFPGYQILFTGVNADPGHCGVRSEIENYVEQQPERSTLRGSLGQVNYLSAMKHCAAVVGNSSSGLIEAPFFPVPTVNIGERQTGRVRASSVIDCATDKRGISAALRESNTETFMNKINNMQFPLGDGYVIDKILRVLHITDFNDLIPKRFCDISN